MVFRDPPPLVVVGGVGVLDLEDLASPVVLDANRCDVSNAAQRRAENIRVAGGGLGAYGQRALSC